MVGTLEKDRLLRSSSGYPPPFLRAEVPMRFRDGFVDHENQGGHAFSWTARDIPLRLHNVCGRLAFQRRPDFLLGKRQEPSD